MSSPVWADIELPNGTVLGDGPLELISCSVTKRLDRAGVVSLTMSGASSRSALVKSRRYQRTFGMVNSTVTELGYGIIDSIGLNADFTMTVEGDDILRELSNRTVKELSLYNDEVFIPKYPRQGSDPSTWILMVDSDPFTGNEIQLQASETWYLGHESSFDRVRWELLSTNNVSSTAFTWEYLATTGNWTTLSLTDETAVTNDLGATFIYGRSGDWFWDPASLTPAWGPKEHAGVTGWWIRWRPAATMYVTIVCSELRVVHRTGTTQALSTILGYTGLPGSTPAWTLDADYHTETSKDVVLTFSGESVLEALVRLAEVTGDHFRLGDGRKIQWLFESDLTQEDYVIRCERPTGSAKRMESNTEMAVLLDAPMVIDSYEVVNRLYAYGGGSGDDRVTLALTSKPAPSGYTLNTTNNYLECDASVASYGLIERFETWADINPESVSDIGRQAAADKLFEAAFEYLKRASEPQVTYSLSLAKCERLLIPGDKLRVIWHEWRSGEHVINIDALVYCLETTVEYDQAGARTTRVVCSTIDRWPVSGASRLVQALGRLRHMLAHNTYATVDYVGNQVTSGVADASLVEVRDRQNVPIFRASRDDSTAEFGPPTTPHIEYDGTSVLLGGSSLNIQGNAVISGTLTASSLVAEYAVTVVTNTYLVLATDAVIVCNKATAFTVTLPVASGSGKAYTIKNIGAGVVTVDGDGSDTIDGQTTQPLDQWDSMQIVDYVANKWVIV